MAEGLLGKLEPFLRGAAGAAAVGANPLIGLLAGPSIRSSSERRALDNDLRREELRGLSRRNRAMSELRGLLADRTTVQGPDRTGTLLGVEQDEQINIPGRRASVPTVQTPAGQNELMGLFAEVAPGQVAASMLSQPQERSETSLIRNMRAAGIDPMTPEGREIVLNQLKGQGANDELMQRINLQMTQMQLEEMRRNREKEEKTATQQRKGLERTLRGGVSDIIEMTSAVRDLEGTFLQPGLPGGDLRRDAAALTGAVRNAFGDDTAELDDNVQKYDTLNKRLNGLILDTLDRFGGTMTDAKFRTLQEASATTRIAPQAIESILQEIGDIYSQQAVDEGIEVGRLSDMRKLFRARGSDSDDAPGNSPDEVRRFRYDPETGRLVPQ